MCHMRPAIVLDTDRTDPLPQRPFLNAMWAEIFVFGHVFFEL